MALRPAKCYKRMKMPYTRVSRRKPRRSYVKGVPETKIHRFVVGNKDSKFSSQMCLVAGQNVLIRHNALEAARISLNKNLEKRIGKDAYFMRILVYPHHVMRENPLATGAGADRFQTGMRKSFGKPIGRAARVRQGQRLIEVWTETGKEAQAKKCLKIAASKLSSTCRIV